MTAREKAIGIVFNLCNSEEGRLLIWSCGLVGTLEGLAHQGNGIKLETAEGAKVKERAEFTLQRLIPTRSGVSSELKLLRSGLEAKAERVPYALQLSHSTKAVFGHRKPGRIWEVLLAPFRKLRSFLRRAAGSAHRGDSRNTTGTDQSIEAAHASSMAAVCIPSIREFDELPRWDTSIVPGHGNGVAENPEMKVTPIGAQKNL